MKRADLNLDNPILIAAKDAFNSCLKMAVAKAIDTGSNEGSVTLKVAFSMESSADNQTGEIEMLPEIKFKAGYSVPMKESMEATVMTGCRLLHGPGGKWLLVDNQISMDELMEEDEEEE